MSPSVTSMQLQIPPEMGTPSPCSGLSLPCWGYVRSDFLGLFSPSPSQRKPLRSLGGEDGHLWGSGTTRGGGIWVSQGLEQHQCCATMRFVLSWTLGKGKSTPRAAISKDSSGN